MRSPEVLHTAIVRSFEVEYYLLSTLSLNVFLHAKPALPTDLHYDSDNVQVYLFPILLSHYFSPRRFNNQPLVTYKCFK